VELIRVFIDKPAFNNLVHMDMPKSQKEEVEQAK
jgi:hypothetical protein